MSVWARLGQFTYEFRMLVQEANQGSSLVVGLLAILLPVLQGRWLGVNGLSKYALRHLQLFT
ncbi:hypothetical protein D3C72_2118580 [compost metagenome]